MLSLLVLILLSVLSCKAVSVHWDYGRNGPDVWSEINATCGGQRQSPINIKTACAVQKNFNPFSLTSNHNKSLNFLMRNNGHTITTETNEEQLILTGGNLNGKFYFDSFHIHWGQNHKSGNEHQVNGVKSAGESHFVYKNNETNERAVLSFLMESRVNKSHNVKNAADAWKLYFDLAQNLTKEDESMRMNFILNSLMGNNLNDFWRYEGSLTTPPCTENVIWTVFKEPIVILDYEFNLFRNYLFFENYRGPQLLYNREVYRSFSDEIPAPNPDQDCCRETKPIAGSVNLKVQQVFPYLFLFSNLFLD